jgi:hypothetical protein
VRADRPLAAVMARSAVLSGVVLLATVPIYVYVEPALRALVARGAAALVLGVTLLQLRRVLAEALEAAGASPLDATRVTRAPEPQVPHHYLGLMSDVRAALRSRRYFDNVMWPRLQALSTSPLDRPPLRPGRGVSLAGLRRVLTALERRP